MTGYQDFLRGRISGLSLTRDGRLTLGSKLDTVFDSGQPEIWSVAQAPDGSLYLGTGHRGRLYKLDAAGKSSLVWTSDQSEIFAVAVDARGVVYAGTSPDGKVYRIENGKATEYFSPGARYIWALKTAPDGSLFVGTGDQGKIFRVTAAGVGSVYYETGQSHVTCLELDSKGALLAGSEPNGILYRITAQNKAFVLYDANLPEIRAIVAADRRQPLCRCAWRERRAANRSRRMEEQTARPREPWRRSIATVTVTDQQAGLAQPPKPEAAKTSVTVQSPVTAVPSGTVDYAGVDKSALYVIHADNTVETLWSSKEENIYDVAMFNSSLLFVTDVQGRLYRLDRDRKATLVAQSNEGEATRLLGIARRIARGDRQSGKDSAPRYGHGRNRMVRIAGARFLDRRALGQALLARRCEGHRVQDAQRKFAAAGRDVERLVPPAHRSGPWRRSRVPTRVTFNGAPNFQGARRSAPSLDSVTIAYLPQNTPPNVRSINVSAVSGSAKSGVSVGGGNRELRDHCHRFGRCSGQCRDAFADAFAHSGPAGANLLAGGRSRWRPADLQPLFSRRGRDAMEIDARQHDREYISARCGRVRGRALLFPRRCVGLRLRIPRIWRAKSELVSAPVLIDSTPPAVTASAPRRNGRRG